MLEPDKFADAYAAELQEIYSTSKNDGVGYAEWYDIYTVNRDIGYQIATTINNYLIWHRRRYGSVIIEEVFFKKHLFFLLFKFK